MQETAASHALCVNCQEPWLDYSCLEDRPNPNQALVPRSGPLELNAEEAALQVIEWEDEQAERIYHTILSTVAGAAVEGQRAYDFGALVCWTDPIGREVRRRLEKQGYEVDAYGRVVWTHAIVRMKRKMGRTCRLQRVREVVGHKTVRYAAGAAGVYSLIYILLGLLT